MDAGHSRITFIPYLLPVLCRSTTAISIPFLLFPGTQEGWQSDQRRGHCSLEETGLWSECRKEIAAEEGACACMCGRRTRRPAILNAHVIEYTRYIDK